MRGFPKTFATKMDYLNTLQLYPEQTRSALRSLHADRFMFVRTAQLETKEEGIEDATHYVMVERDNETEVEHYYQMEQQVDPNARCYRLGFTDEELVALYTV